MPTVKKTVKGNKHNDMVMSGKIKSYESDSFFVEKAEKAKAFLQKNPLPGHLKK